MTENDTFKRLSRPSYKEMMKLIMDRLIVKDVSIYKSNDAWIESHGWTMNELLNYNKKK